jgi:hypothetical protein
MKFIREIFFGHLKRLDLSPNLIWSEKVQMAPYRAGNLRVYETIEYGLLAFSALWHLEVINRYIERSVIVLSGECV